MSSWSENKAFLRVEFPSASTKGVTRRGIGFIVISGVHGPK
jgi:hypothetical protein